MIDTELYEDEIVDDIIEDDIIEEDEEFDRIMLDSKVRYISILILSILWIIALPTMIVINLFNKEEV